LIVVSERGISKTIELVPEKPNTFSVKVSTDLFDHTASLEAIEQAKSATILGRIATYLFARLPIIKLLLFHSASAGVPSVAENNGISAQNEGMHTLLSRLEVSDTSPVQSVRHGSGLYPYPTPLPPQNPHPEEPFSIQLACNEQLTN